uniref:phosphoribosylamine--glycine ligase n=1 Tax=Eptatretus burgeri TaxID=7764 RepID=A0A8C4QD51_EPTBU
SARAACLESSKAYSKAFMDRHGIPTARWKAFECPDEACAYIRSADFPALVVKASGLAAGKGVSVASTQEEACEAVMQIMKGKRCGAAGDTVVVEELLEGEEISCLCFTDGHSITCMPPAQDHKQLCDGDRGPNTGGMGAYAPMPQVPVDVLVKIEDILQRTVDGMCAEGSPYVGVLYAGIMLTKDGPKVLEFNCRFGDPECQVINEVARSDEWHNDIYHLGSLGNPSGRRCPLGVGDVASLLTLLNQKVETRISTTYWLHGKVKVNSQTSPLPLIPGLD